MQKEIQWLLKDKYNNKPTKQFKKDIVRLEKGEPLDYVIGFKEFLGCKIDLSKKPLIPRIETEFWVGQELKNIKSGKVLDIFCGSGCIGLALMENSKNLLCDFADVENKMVGHKVIKSNIFSGIKSKYDFILANPPYIPTTKKNKVQKSVLKYEPKKALFGGKDGMYFINKFLKDAQKYLNVGGRIFMEFDPPQKKGIEKLLKKYKYKSWQFNKDQFNKWRWVSME